MAGLFDGIESAVMNPLFMGGAGLALSGDAQGLFGGMQQGSQYQDKRRKRAAFEGLFNDPEAQKQLAPIMPVLKAGGEDMLPMAGQFLAKAPDREFDREKFAHTKDYNWATLDEQRRNHDMQAQRLAADQYGKAGTIVQGPDGKHYSIQFGSNGRKIVEPLQYGETSLTPSKGVDVVGDTMYDKTTGQMVRNVAPNIAGGEQAKVQGKETGERIMGLPKAESALASAEAKSQIVRDKIAQALPMVSSWTAGPGSLLSNIPGTSARDLAEIKDTIVANLGFEELQDMRTNSPTGGALGAIAVQELAMLQKTKASIEQAQSVPQLRRALVELDGIMKSSGERRRQAFSATYGNIQQQARQPVGGATQQQPQQPPAAAAISPDAVQMLRSNPSPQTMQQFDEIFGPGSAQRALGGR